MAVTVTDDQVAVLRAQLRGDFEEYERLYAEVDKSDSTGYSALISAAFVLAAERRFRPDGTRPDIIMFVASVRAKSRKLAEGIDPIIGERLILAALVDESIEDIDADAAKKTQLLLLTAMTAADDFPASDVDGLLSEARALVGRAAP